jgi:GNAT superfamily N-acetyltransferase
MANVTIRPTDPERDAAALVELARETEPFTPMTVASWLHRETSVPEAAELLALVAEVEGEVVGESYAMREWWHSGDAVQVFVAVREHARRRGVGTALYDAAMVHAERLAPSRYASKLVETPAGMAFAHARGFAEVRAERYSAVDPREIREQPAAKLRPASEVDARVLHHIDETSMLSMPSLEPYEPTPFEQWKSFVLERPLLQAEGSFVTYADGEPAAMSLLTADLETGRGVNMYTGTLPEFRGRGLALAAKLGVLNWAAEHGITVIYTTNDETNAPMLAINDRLGYRPTGRRVELSHPLWKEER